MRARAEALLRQHRLLAILRAVPHEHVAALGQAIYAGGFRLLEVTLSHPGGLEAIGILRSALPGDALVGAGTVLTTEDADAALAGGAQFLVAPHLDDAVFAFAQERDVLLLPGVMTPGEVARAWRLGCRLQKLFPADALGPGYVSALLGPFPDVELLAVGGVDADNLTSYLQAGALGAGVGGLLTRQDWRAPDLLKVRQEARRLGELVQQAP